jgi:hypothetical protein
MEWFHVRASNPERWTLWHAPVVVSLEKRSETWLLYCEPLGIDTGTNTPCLEIAKRRAISCIRCTLRANIARDQILLQEFDTMGDS